MPLKTIELHALYVSELHGVWNSISIKLLPMKFKHTEIICYLTSLKPSFLLNNISALFLGGTFHYSRNQSPLSIHIAKFLSRKLYPLTLSQALCGECLCLHLMEGEIALFKTTHMGFGRKARVHT